ncbi:glycerol-3-phosphate dehydrogenase/oxidase [Acidobacteria bacterium ACD]|nr:MAG: glycerol-3-phosphate dehydrogenase/oxidase [Acidobacteriota bacterium]MCE7958864.1 glycerol-3-phosphate dehydrogenase/oxidase [Acidobacteria bacterium ACB2]MDL1951997.1 glycerol-3-phosphate dehydrogenase/oxidase [Acidobacteria bacterium ACD]
MTPAAPSAASPASLRRAASWKKLAETSWDLLIVGGGITGAGILREAVRHGLSAALVERRDFAWGTSSRSSKLVHGGLRYLAQGRIGLTRDSVRERERLVAEGPGLVSRLGFLMASYDGEGPSPLLLRSALTVYDLLALSWSHRRYSSEDLLLLAPRLLGKGLEGGFRYGDAQTDDARLVWRVIADASRAGGLALNDAPVEELVLSDGRVTGAVVRDALSGTTARVAAKVVVNATGVWADGMRARVGGEPRLRPLRGSHLVFPAWRVPVAQAVCFPHPRDARPVFIFPWEGTTLVGTTDVDHDAPLDEEPSISPEETAYLLEAVSGRLPGLSIGPSDVIATYSGVRPVVGTGKANPSEESREHVIWDERGLLTVTGGKLTTFRLIALDALKAARERLPGHARLDRHARVLDAVDPSALDHVPLPPESRLRLLGRHGADATAVVAAARRTELQKVPGTSVLWAELRLAARQEAVSHLDDLLLRRTRLGLLLPEGAREHLPEVAALCREELGWDAARWEREAARYAETLRRCYGVPPAAILPETATAANEA